MSASCFTCSQTNGELSLMTETCYWDVLRSLLLPEQNIEHVCFPNTKLYFCTQCQQMLQCISEFKIVAVTSVHRQLQHWKNEMESLSSKTETENLAIKQEVLNEYPNDSAQESKNESLHEEVMLDLKEDVKCEIELENQDVPNCTEDAQNEWLVNSRLLEVTPELNDVDQQNDIYLKMEASSPPDSGSEESDPDEASSISPVPEASTSTYYSRKRTIVPEPQPASGAKKGAGIQAGSASDPMKDYLTAWGLEMYITKFKEQAIDVETLQMLSETDIKELVPVIGHRAKLNAQIKMLKSRTEMDMDISEDPSISNHTSTTHVQQPFVNTEHSNSPDTSESIITNTEMSCPDTSCELFKILKSSNDGKALYLRHKDTGLINNADRRRLCSIIINYELKDDPQKKITSARLYKLAYEIPKIFKKENSSVYFIPYTSISRKQKVSAKGKLLDYYRQRRREFIKSGVIEAYSKRQSSTSTNSVSASPRVGANSNIQEAIDQLQTLSDDVDGKLLWLHNCCQPWGTVEAYWKDTCKQRLTQLTSTEMIVDEYLSKYKPLNQPGGVMLLLKDFKNLFPLCDDKLYQTWPLIRSKILEYCKKRQDSGLKEILSLIQNDDTEEVLDTVAFMALPFLMTPSILKARTKTKKQWRPSKHEVLESFLCHLKTEAEIEETIQRRKAKLNEFGFTPQPFVIIVGPSIKEISARYVVLNHLRYEITSVVKCVDACFKMIFVLNAEYPAESSHVWQFIQKAVFNLNTKYDKLFTTVRTLVTDLGLKVK